MKLYIEFIYDLIEEDEFNISSGDDFELQELLTELKSLYQDYSIRIKPFVTTRTDERYYTWNCSKFKHLPCREESSLFQPGSEVFLEGQTQNSILETVQDLVQRDIVEAVVEPKNLSIVHEDPLNVMEPRPTKSFSEDSLFKGSKTIYDVYDLLLETCKRVDILEEQVKSLQTPCIHSFCTYMLKHYSTALRVLKVIDYALPLRFNLLLDIFLYWCLDMAVALHKAANIIEIFCKYIHKLLFTPQKIQASW